jgi:hypothetical protein
MSTLWLNMIMVLFLAASRKSKSAIPLIGSCSAAIVASYHVFPREMASKLQY